MEKVAITGYRVLIKNFTTSGNHVRKIDVLGDIYESFDRARKDAELMISSISSCITTSDAEYICIDESVENAISIIKINSQSKDKRIVAEISINILESVDGYIYYRNHTIQPFNIDRHRIVYNGAPISIKNSIESALLYIDMSICISENLDRRQ